MKTSTLVAERCKKKPNSVTKIPNAPTARVFLLDGEDHRPDSKPCILAHVKKNDMRSAASVKEAAGRMSFFD